MKNYGQRDYHWRGHFVDAGMVWRYVALHIFKCSGMEKNCARLREAAEYHFNYACMGDFPYLLKSKLHFQINVMNGISF